MIKRLIAALITVGTLVPASLRADVASDIETLTGTHTRVVWIESSGDSKDRYAHDPINKLMGIDTDDGQGIVEINPTRASYHKPMVLPHGDRIVYTNMVTGNVEVIDWDGTGTRVVVAGICCDVWLDSETDVEYIIVGDDAPGYLTRYAVDDTSDRQLIWDNTVVGSATFGAITFQLSGDGKHGWGGFPWPNTFFVNLPNGHMELLDEGCWPAMAPEISYLAFVFNTDHRTVSLYDPTYTQLCELDVHNAPGIKGWEVCHVKWGNTDDFITITGPYDGGDGGYCETDDCGNFMNAGGTNMNLYLGKLAEDRLTVAGWVRITDNDQADFFGDVWIDPGVRSRYEPVITDQPDDRTVFENNDVNLQVKVDAWPYPDYQWYKDGAPVDSAEFSVLMLKNMTAADAGTYTVMVSSSAGTTMSDNAVLTVESVAGDNLILHYAFETAACTDLAGGSDGEIHDASLSSDAVVGSGSYSFDGDDYVTAGNPSVLSNLFPYSFSAWIKPAVLGGPVISKTEVVGYWGRCLTVESDGAVRMWVGRVGGDHNVTRTAAGAVATGTWQHIAVTQATLDDSARIFVNGMEAVCDTVRPGSGRIEADGDAVFNVGGYECNSGDRYFTGQIDDVRVFNYTLTSAEVAALHGMTGMRPADHGPETHVPFSNVPNPVTSSALQQWRNFQQVEGMVVRLYTADGRDVTNAMPEAGTCLYRAVGNGKIYYGKVMVIE